VTRRDVPAHLPGMTRDANGRNHAQAGIRTGGQYITQARAEADVALVDPADAPHRDSELVGPGEITDLEADRLAVQALMAARHHAHIKGLRFSDPRDIAQSTVVTILEARRNSPQNVVTPSYVHRIASGHVAIAIRGNLRVEDRKAKAIYDVKVREEEDRLGRRTSGTERRAIAETIREQWPDQRHKPSKRFVELAEIRVRSLDAPEGGHDSTTTLGDMVASQVASTDHDAIDPGSRAGQVLALAEGEQYVEDSDGAHIEKTGRRRAAARDMLWSAFEEMSGVPPVKAGTVTGNGDSVRAELAAAGGVAQACADWNRGLDTPATDALFTPFGPLSADQRDDVVDLLSGQRAYAEDMWDSAVRAAVKASSKKGR